jgi:hypothetical protein
MPQGAPAPFFPFGEGAALFLPVFLKSAGTPTGCYGNGKSPGMKKRKNFTSDFAASNDYKSVRGIRTPNRKMIQ